MAGLVFSGERRLDKAGLQVPEDIAIEMRGQDHPWVSRGGLKLEHALDAFAIDPAGAVAIDVGASTGGFTDVLLTGGAARVFEALKIAAADRRAATADPAFVEIGRAHV